jgi:hypothetical protein
MECGAFASSEFRKLDPALDSLPPPPERAPGREIGVRFEHKGADMAPDNKPNIVLVHGAWADGSSWSGVIEQMQAAGHEVTAPQFGMGALADDVARPPNTPHPADLGTYSGTRFEIRGPALRAKSAICGEFREAPTGIGPV